jgi:tetratricopeptide (TPR) repeat protein
MWFFRTQTRLLILLLPAMAAAGDEEIGSQVCSRCHAEIYRKYSATSMSRSSGKAGASPLRESFERATFSDAVLGAQYRISETAGAFRLEFSRSESGAKGQRMLEWFVGSGRVGRSYISSLDGFLFQAPVSYFSRGAKWDLSPGYQQHQFIHLTRAVGVGCLQCHASRLQPVAGTQNRFTTPPFLEGGVSCERCHGPGKNHVAAMTSGKRKGSEIVNPAKLEPARRDSVCAQCHLTGAARIVRAKADYYQPGKLLSDYASYFVWSGPDASSMSANSHFEKLQQSACKGASGDRLWCGSCHDPHTEPAETARATFYRSRCQKCHQPAACRENPETRSKAQDDCIACHMPKGEVRDTEHAVFTDHTIPRRGRPPAATSGSDRSLTSFWKAPVDDRDLGLALATVAGADSRLRQRAFDLLRKSEARDPKDILILAQLAQFYDQSGDEAAAMGLSERIIRLDPAQVAVAVNLGTYYIKRGRAREAMRLWTDALSRNPGLTSVRMNLAVAQYQGGDRAGAEATVLKLLEYDPDQETARQLLSEIRAAR